MKKILVVFILFISIITFNVSALELDINSKNAILYNLDSDEILYEKDADTKVQIASLTKIMTALVTIEKINDLNKQVIISYDDLNGLSSLNLVTAGFTVGETVTYKDLLYGLLLPSGADAATCLARNVGGSTEEFVKLMNEKVQKLKLKNTNFSNPIGLDDENNYSTVRELSLIWRKALENDTFKEIITSKEYTTSDGKIKFKSTILSNAKKYNIDIPYVEGGKTGTTDGAGLCLASIAYKDVNFLLVTTGALYDKKAPHHIEDAKIIYDYFINNYSNQKIVNKNKSFKTLKTKYLKEDNIKIYPSRDVIKYLPNEYDIDDIKYDYKGIDVVNIKTKGKIGTLKIYYKDELISKQNIYLNKKLHFDIFKFIKGNILIIVFVISVVICMFILIKRQKKRTRN